MPPVERDPLALPEAPPLDAPDDLAARLEAIGVSLDEVATLRLRRYLAALLAMNEKMNLTAITAPDEVWSRHALDALSLVALLPPPREGLALADVGSGGGVPGIPVAIARPDLAMTLIEATQKKATFLADVAATLGLKNVRVVASRAEALARSPHRAAYDVVTARAVGRLQVLVPWTLPLLKRGGVALLIKGQKADEELAEADREIRRQGARHERTVPTPTGRVVVLRG
ncbi:MAG: 16S rRNA (guanine(527)-N(7))-methyltransferase RsmG [Polyangiales bacterium]